MKVPDWTPAHAAGPDWKVNGTTVTLTWHAAADNIGVVGYDVLRDAKHDREHDQGGAQVHRPEREARALSYVVQARDDQGNATASTGQNVVVRKPHVKATVVALKMAGALRGGASRYAINGPARLLLDVRIVGDLKKAKLRVYVQSGKGRITVWRGTPGPRRRASGCTRRSRVTGG